MCGIFFAYSKNKNFLSKIRSKQSLIIDTIKRRGPDLTTSVKDSNFLAIHTLLSITGFRPQPIINNEFLLMFNGEIYNDYKKYNDNYSDTDFIVNKIKEKGAKAFKILDGEFAIVTHLLKSNTLILAADPFGTKPLYYQLGNDFCIVGSYESTIAACSKREAIKQIRANSVVEIDLKHFSVKDEEIVKSFDFSKQNNNSFEKWNEAFTESLVKRTQNKNHICFVSFSSGHDSGLIAAELINLKIPFKAYLMTYLEDPIILSERIELLKRNKISYEIINPSKKTWNSMKKFVENNIDPYKLISSDDSYQNFDNPNIHKIPGTISSSLIHQKAREDKYLIHLSGQGGDEIYSDYYNKYTHSRMSELKGNWRGVKAPWKNFYGSWNRVFLGATERVGGLFGIETRYPYLDYSVVQEFLNLSPKLKSHYYKAPITNRLRELNFPFHFKKYGFAGYKDNALSTRPPIAK